MRLQALFAKLFSQGWNRFYRCALLAVWTLYSIQVFLWNHHDRPDPYPAATFLISLLLTAVMVAYKWAIRRMGTFGRDIQHLLLPPEESWDTAEVNQWYPTELEHILTWKKSIWFGLAFTIIALVVVIELEPAAWFPTQLSRLFGLLSYVLIGTAFGACVWPGYRMSVFVYRLADKIQTPNPFMPRTSGIFNIGRTLVKFEAAGIGLILLFGAAVSRSPYSLSHTLILYISSIVSVIWAFWFFFTQSQVHRAMLRYKNEKQEWFAEHYEKKLTSAVRKPERHVLEELERLAVLKKAIDSIPAWPFDTRALLTSLSLISTPILAALADWLLHK